jgi:hypothetical protein
MSTRGIENTLTIGLDVETVVIFEEEKEIVTEKGKEGVRLGLGCCLISVLD